MTALAPQMGSALAPSVPSSAPPAAARFEDAEVRALLASRPMSGLLRLAFAREPSFELAARVEGVRHTTFVARDHHERVVALGARSVRPVYLGGEVRLVGYLGQLRMAEHAVGIKRLRAGFDHLEASRRDDELPFDITTIVADNLPAKRLLTRGLRGLPVYHPLAELDTLVLSTRAITRAHTRLRARSFRAGRADDLPMIASALAITQRRFNFAPVWTADELGPGGRARDLCAEDFVVLGSGAMLVACGAVWDQRRFKQTVVTGYAPWLAALRPLVNVGMWAAGQPILPKAPGTLALAYLSHLVAPDHETLVGLVAQLCVRAHARGIEQLALTLAEVDPRRDVLRRAFAARSYPSTLYAVAPRGSALLVETLRARVPFVEAATL